MEKLTLEHIAPYMPYRLKAVKVNHFEITVKGAYESNYDILYFISASDSNFVANDCKIYLHPMDLTKPIIVEGKEIIPIVELAKIAFPDERMCLNHRKKIAENGQKQFFKINDLDFCFSSMFFSAVSVSGDIHFKIFKWLFKHKFDVFNLIPAGLAIDVNTLEINPYE